MLEIHDIKPLVEVPDYSLYILIVLIVFAVILIGALLFWFYKLFKNDRSIEKRYFQELKELDFKDAKHCAYLITKYTRVLAKSEREKRLSAELIYALSDYKYKKEVKPIDKSIKAKLEVFLENVHV